MEYLIDTGVLLRLFDASDPEHSTIRRALSSLRMSGHTPATCSQNIAEFWSVSTRPKAARGGYGQTVDATERRVAYLERACVILPDSPAAYSLWRGLLTKYGVQGVAAHDARLVAMMQCYGITHILTANKSDFQRYADLIVLTPAEFLSRSRP